MNGCGNTKRVWDEGGGRARPPRRPPADQQTIKKLTSLLVPYHRRGRRERGSSDFQSGMYAGSLFFWAPCLSNFNLLTLILVHLPDSNSDKTEAQWMKLNNLPTYVSSEIVRIAAAAAAGQRAFDLCSD